ncbi:tRNA methyltransferase 10 [Nowakowskiella sp. JEL0078]|nr:tRNA methyltransferase 10 [Nowakowskiella sp. JEL0078]
MTGKEIASTVLQVTRCYAFNKSAPVKLNLHASSFNSKIKQVFDKSQPHHQAWDVKFHDQKYKDAFCGRTKDLVYLSGDSPNVLQHLDESKIYVIGGLVDRNRHKVLGYLCQERAESERIPTARLPISEHIDMKSRQILTINQVFEILSGYMETRDWLSVLTRVLPKRKIWTEKQGEEAERDEQGDLDGESQSEDEQVDKHKSDIEERQEEEKELLKEDDIQVDQASKKIRLDLSEYK